MMPTLMGLMLCSLDKSQRSLGNALAQFFYCLLGYIPSPVLYGLVVSMDSNKPSRSGMKLIVFWAVQGLFLLGFAYVTEIKQKTRKKLADQIIHLELELQYIKAVKEKETPGNIPIVENKQIEKEMKIELE